MPSHTAYGTHHHGHQGWNTQYHSGSHNRPSFPLSKDATADGHTSTISTARYHGSYSNVAWGRQAHGEDHSTPTKGYISSSNGQHYGPYHGHGYHFHGAQNHHAYTNQGTSRSGSKRHVSYDLPLPRSEQTRLDEAEYAEQLRRQANGLPRILCGALIGIMTSSRHNPSALASYNVSPQHRPHQPPQWGLGAGETLNPICLGTSDDDPPASAPSPSAKVPTLAARAADRAITTATAADSPAPTGSNNSGSPKSLEEYNADSISSRKKLPFVFEDQSQSDRYALTTGSGAGIHSPNTNPSSMPTPNAAMVMNSLNFISSPPPNVFDDLLSTDVMHLMGDIEEHLNQTLPEICGHIADAVTPIVVIGALRYLAVAQSLNVGRVEGDNWFRLFFTALLVSSKMHLDLRRRINKVFAGVLEISVKEMDQLEVELLFMLDFNLLMSEQEYLDYAEWLVEVGRLQGREDFTLSWLTTLEDHAKRSAKIMQPSTPVHTFGGSRSTPMTPKAATHRSIDSSATSPSLSAGAHYGFPPPMELTPSEGGCMDRGTPMSCTPLHTPTHHGTMLRGSPHKTVAAFQMTLATTSHLDTFLSSTPRLFSARCPNAPLWGESPFTAAGHPDPFPDYHDPLRAANDTPIALEVAEDSVSEDEKPPELEVDTEMTPPACAIASSPQDGPNHHRAHHTVPSLVSPPTPEKETKAKEPHIVISRPASTTSHMPIQACSSPPRPPSPRKVFGDVSSAEGRRPMAHINGSRGFAKEGGAPRRGFFAKASFADTQLPAAKAEAPCPALVGEKAAVSAPRPSIDRREPRAASYQILDKLSRNSTEDFPDYGDIVHALPLDGGADKWKDRRAAPSPKITNAPNVLPTLELPPPTMPANVDTTPPPRVPLSAPLLLDKLLSTHKPSPHKDSQLNTSLPVPAPSSWHSEKQITCLPTGLLLLRNNNGDTPQKHVPHQQQRSAVVSISLAPSTGNSSFGGDALVTPTAVHSRRVVHGKGLSGSDFSGAPRTANLPHSNTPLGDISPIGDLMSRPLLTVVAGGSSVVNVGTECSSLDERFTATATTIGGYSGGNLVSTNDNNMQLAGSQPNAGGSSFLLNHSTSEGFDADLPAPHNGYSVHRDPMVVVGEPMMHGGASQGPRFPSAMLRPANSTITTTPCKRGCFESVDSINVEVPLPT